MGNICRSPMAEYLLRAWLEADGLDVSVNSAGIGALVGRPAHDHALALLGARGIDASTHRARQIEPAMLRESDLTLVMETGHRHWIESRFPAACGRVFRLGHMQKAAIPDPYGRGMDAFEHTLEQVDAGIAGWQAKLRRLPAAPAGIQQNALNP